MPQKKTTPEAEAPEGEAGAEAWRENLDRDGDGAPGGSLENLTTYLTTRASDEFGPHGWFVDLKPKDAEKHLKATSDDDGPLLVLPTAEQLAARRR